MKRTFFLPVVFSVFSVAFLCMASPASADVSSPGWSNAGATWAPDLDAAGISDIQAYDGILYVSIYKASPTGLPSENQLFEAGKSLSQQTYRQLMELSTAAEVWSFDGTTWAQSGQDGFGDVNNIRIDSLEVYDGKLIAATMNIMDGAELWQFDGTTWSLFKGGGIENIENYSASSLLASGSSLYVGLSSISTGAEVFAYNGTSWTKINANGFGGALNRYADALGLYNSHLYCASSTDGGQVRIWRYDGGTTWTQANTDSFGDSNNWLALGLASYDGFLYVGTFADEGGQVWRYNGSTWQQINVAGFGDPLTGLIFDLKVYNGKLYAAAGGLTGAHIWQWDGATWTAVGDNGLGDVDRFMCTALGAFQGKLFGGITYIFSSPPAEVWSWYSIDTLPVYRFWNTTYHHHFYTIDANEKDMIIATWPSWRYEGIAFHAAPVDAGLAPVYRFWSAQNHGHFFTIDEAEKDYVIAHYTDSQWLYEGIAYYAATGPFVQTNPLYRFWSAQNRGHFFTTDQAERDYVIDHYTDYQWLYEGTGYYVFPIPSAF